MKTEIEIFCNNIVFLRKQYGLSKRKMAEMLHIGVNSLNSIENGRLPPRISIDIFFRVWEVFGIKPGEQLENDLSKKSPSFKGGGENLPVEACENVWLVLRLAYLLLGKLDSLDEECHVSAYSAHCPHALCVSVDILRSIAVDHVPVTAGGDWHLRDGEVLVQHVKGGCIAATAGGDHCSTDLISLVKTGAVEEPVKEGKHSTVWSAEINRGAHNDAVALGKLWCYLVDDVVEYTLTGLTALAAADASADILVANVDHLRLKTLFFEGVSYLSQSCVGAAFSVGASVDKNYFHDISSLLISCVSVL